MRVLVDAGANVNLQDKYGRSPLHAASDSGRLDVVRVLVDAGADVNLQDANGSSALHYASDKGHVDVARVLVDAGADVNLQDRRSSSALHAACYSGDEARVRVPLGALTAQSVTSNAIAESVQAEALRDIAVGPAAVRFGCCVPWCIFGPLWRSPARVAPSTL